MALGTLVDSQRALLCGLLLGVVSYCGQMSASTGAIVSVFKSLVITSVVRPHKSLNGSSNGPLIKLTCSLFQYLVSVRRVFSCQVV